MNVHVKIQRVLKDIHYTYGFQQLYVHKCVGKLQVFVADRRKKKKNTKTTKSDHFTSGKTQQQTHLKFMRLSARFLVNIYYLVMYYLQ